MTGREPGRPPLVVVMGVAGSGKSTVGAALATALSVRFVDGDQLHPPANIAKLAAGTPLDDDDRRPWLARVGAALVEAGDGGLVVACSALRRSYRDAIRAVAPRVVFVQLTASRDVLERRLRVRRNHFMPASLLDSQLAAFEPLGDDERGVVVDAAQPISRAVDDAASGVRLLSARASMDSLRGRGAADR